MSIAKTRSVQYILIIVVMGWLTACNGTQLLREQSPLSPLPSPTHPAADLIPPTPTPTSTTSSGLREWPTPTPTPLPPQAERARQFVAEQEGIPADQLHLHWESTILRPSTGEELWAGRILDTASGHYYEVSVDASGHAAYLPDFSDQAVALIAEQEGIPAEELIVANTVNAIFQFSHQFVWRAKIIANGDFYEVNFNLDGNPVDITAIERAEELARETQCPKLEIALCQTLLRSSSDDTQHVRIFLREEADPGIVVRRIGEAGYEYHRDGQVVYAQLPKYLILELTALDAVHQIISHWVARTVPLDSNLFFAFEEAGGQITLKVWTEKIYGCCNYEIDAELLHPNPREFEVMVKGIYRPAECLTTTGPATWEVNLGELDKVYDLVFIYEDLRSHHRLTISPESIVVKTEETEFTQPKYETWLRLPPDAIWFVAQARAVYPEGTSATVERSTYEADVERFFADLEKLSVEPFVPQEGIYSNRWFVPPWSGWWQSEGEYILIPIDEHSFYHFKWPDIRYYHYSGPAEPIRELIQGYSSAIVSIAGYTWEGEPLLQGGGQ